MKGFKLLFFVLIAVMSQASAAFAEVVREISFDGNQRVPEETILANIRTRPGAQMDRSIIQNDIKSLYALGQFTNVKVEAARRGDGLKLTYVLTEKPLIAEVGFEGNKKFKDDKLREEIDIPTFQPLDDKKLAESIRKIKDLYAKKGFYLTEVEHQLGTNADGDTKLILVIQENEKAYIKRVQFLGNKVFSNKALRNELKSKSKGFFSFLTKSGSYDEEMLKIDVMRLTYFYLNHGYFRVRIVPPRVSITKDKRYIFVTFEINEGKQYKFGTLDIEGDILTTKEELLSLVGCRVGSTYNRSQVDTDVMKLTERYGEQGYAFTNVMPQHIPDDDNLTVNLTYNIEKGDKITIERINISGNTTTRDKVIRRELNVKENDRYSLKALRRSREKLEALGYFSEINFATPRGSKDDTVELNVDVEEKPTRTFNISAGFSSLENFIFNASFSVQNFLGYGIGGSLMAELSKKRQNFSLMAQDSYFLDTQWMLGGSAYSTAFNYGDYRRKSLGGDLSLGHRIFEYWAAFLGYKFEKVQVDDFSWVVPQLFRKDSSGLTSELSLKLQYDRRNNRIFTTKGFLASMDNEVSGNKLGGNNNFYRIDGVGQFYWPLLKPLIFKQYARIGYIRSLDKSPVPLYERYFLGGINSLRGYDWSSVGPRVRIPSSPSNPEGEFTYGGDKQLLFVTELECLIFPKGGIALVGFFDAGNAFGEEQNFSIRDLRTDAGFGIRWNSPMAPLRFEWGFPLNKRKGDASYQFQFGMGSFF